MSLIYIYIKKILKNKKQHKLSEIFEIILWITNIVNAKMFEIYKLLGNAPVLHRTCNNSKRVNSVYTYHGC